MKLTCNDIWLDVQQREAGEIVDHFEATHLLASRAVSTPETWTMQWQKDR